MFVEKSRIAMAHAGRLAIVIAVLLALQGSAQAGMVTIDEVGVNAIFSQETFGNAPVSIRFNPAQTIVAPDLLVINTASDLQTLYSLVPNPSPGVAAFFVDIINACVTVDVAEDGKYFGCGQLPGNFMVLNSNKAQLVPADLIAHELGHNFGLQHTSLGLMSPLLGFSAPFLFEDQVAQILQSPLVQLDANGQRFVTITPIAIVNAPEPSSFLLAGGALGILLIASMRNPKARRSRIKD